MPSFIDQPTHVTRRRGLSASTRFREIVSKKQLTVLGPWGGFIPDINDSLMDLRVAKNCQGYIGRGGKLVRDTGFSRLEDSTGVTLPLGDASPPADTDDALGITGIFQYAEINTGNLVQVAMTAVDAAGAGHLYEYDGTDWANFTISPTVGETNMLGDFSLLYDVAFLPWLDITDGGAGTGAPGTGQIIFCNRNVGGSAHVYPETHTAVKKYFDFDGNTTFTNFNAISVENFADRACFLNTEEEGSEFENRFRWTRIASDDFTGLGAGAIDFDDFQKRGLRIESLGDVCAAYFGDGVAFIRRQGLSVAPFRVDVLTKKRGLLGTFSMVNLGGGEHFGIFEDGWFILDVTGRWREVGLATVGGAIRHKWLQTFFGLLDYTNRQRIVCTYDRNEKLVRIAFPTGDRANGAPDRVWSYDLRTDTVWPDTWGSLTPNVWGEYDDEATQLLWSDFPGQWDDETEIWDLDAGIGRFRMLHGTTDGLIFHHSRANDRRDGNQIISSFLSHSTEIGDIARHANVDKLWVEYINPGDQSDGNPAADQTLEMFVDGTAYGMSFSPTKGNALTSQVDFVTANQTGRRIAWKISGNNTPHIRSLRLDYFDHATDEKSRG